jgi:hypothetical protein
VRRSVPSAEALAIDANFGGVQWTEQRRPCRERDSFYFRMGRKALRHAARERRCDADVDDAIDLERRILHGRVPRAL